MAVDWVLDQIIENTSQPSAPINLRNCVFSYESNGEKV